MKKPSRFLALFALSFPLAAFSLPPRPASAQKPILTIEATSQISADGSGAFILDLTFDKKMVDLFQSLPNSSEKSVCDFFNLGSTAGTEWTEEKAGDGTRCHSSQPFKNLDALKSLTEEDFSPAYFNRLEIAGGHLYYDLVWNADMGSQFPTSDSFVLQAYMILKMPGNIVKNNATKTNGSTLTWDLATLGKSSHIQAESTLGGSFLGMDPTVLAILILVTCGCCLVILLLGGGIAAYLILRKRKSPQNASEPSTPAGGSAGPPPHP